MGEPTGQLVYEFGDFRLDPGQRRLESAGGRRVFVRAKAFDALLYLVERAGQLVEKEALLHAVWPNAVVEENNLNQVISTLRRLLDDDRVSPRFIATVPGRGYQFVAEVRRRARSPHAIPESGTAPGTRLQPAATGTRAAADLPSADPNPQARRYILVASTIGLGLAGAVLAAYLLTADPGRERTPRVLSDQHLVSASPGSHRSPTFSPDGTMLAFVRDASGKEQLWIQNLAGGNPVQITDGDAPANRPAWSPRNDQIVFHRPGDGIWTVGTLGTPTPRRIIEYGRNPGFSADGGTIVYERGREIWLADADGSGQRRVDGVPFHSFINVSSWPSLSPDGKHIAFFHSEAALEGDIWTIPAGGGEARRLTFDTVAASNPAWSVDGSHIIYASMRSGTRTLWRVAVDGGEPEPVTSGVGEDSEPVISRDGQRMLYTNTRSIWRLMSRDTESGRHETLYESRYPIRLPDASPDGEAVAFFSDRVRGTHLFVVRHDGTELRQLTFGAGKKNTLPYWSADGRSIYYFEGRPALSLQKVPSAGGASSHVIADFHWSTGRTWAAERPGGEELAFVDWSLPDYSDNRTIIRSLATGAETTLSRPAVLAPAWSRDGSVLIGYSRGDGLVICEAVPETCRGLSGDDEPFPGTHPRWSSDGTRIFFFRTAQDPQHHELWVVDRNGKNSRRLFDVGPIASSDVQFAVVRDDHIVWAQYDRGDDEIWLARFGTEPIR